MNLANIIAVSIRKTCQLIIKLLGLKYFCNTHIGVSTNSAIKLPNHKNSHTKSTDWRTIQKKNTAVKWKIIHTNQNIAVI